MVFAVEDIFTDTPESKIKNRYVLKNINAFCETLEKSDWDFILDENDINKAFENFYSRINATADISFPLKHVKGKKLTNLRG